MFRTLFRFFAGEPTAPAAPQEALPGGQAFFENDSANPEGDETPKGEERPGEAVAPKAEDKMTGDDKPKTSASKSTVSDDDVEETDEQTGESEATPEAKGDGAGNDGDANDAVALAIRTAVKARLSAQKDTQGKAEEATKFTVSMPSVEALKEIPDLKDVDDEDLKRIHAIAAAVVKQAVSTFYEGTTKPFVESLTKHTKAQRAQESAAAFNKKYPGVLKEEANRVAMLAVYDELSKEFGKDLAESVSLEELYLASGAKGKKAAAKATEGIVSKAAEQQKAEATKAQQTTERVARVRAGGPSKRDPETDIRRSTFDHIRRTTFQPFVIRPRGR